MRVARLRYLFLSAILILACAFGAQAKTTLSPAPKITPQVLRNKIIFLRGSNVWVFDPRTRREQILFKANESSWRAFASGEAGGF